MKCLEPGAFTKAVVHSCVRQQLDQYMHWTRLDRNAGVKKPWFLSGAPIEISV